MSRSRPEGSPTSSGPSAAPTAVGPYDSAFATLYDRITTHKDYPAEVAVLDRIIQDAVRPANPRVLDVGCGTGTHATLLAARGYKVTAIDLSPEMIRVARAKTSAVEFHSGPIASLPSDDFHFCYAVFNVINCLPTVDALITFFADVAARLARGAEFLVEAWNPIAVISEPPQVVERVFEDADDRITRTVVPQPDFLHQRLDLEYQITVKRKAGRHAPKHFTVTHELVLFTPLEVEYGLRLAGFDDIAVHTALPELSAATANDRMLAFTCVKAEAPQTREGPVGGSTGS